MLEELLVNLRMEVSGHIAMEYAREIYSRDRWSTFPKYYETCEFCEKTLQEIGASDVEFVELPADGKTKFGDWVMPIAWDVRDAILEITEPVLSQKDETVELLQTGTQILANRRDVPNVIAMWSAPTPPEGVEGEVLVLNQGTREECEGLDLKGKMVLTPGDPREIKGVVAERGGLGIISDYIRNPDLLDATHWVNGWGDKPGTWMMTAQDSKMFAFSLSPRKGRFLRGLIKKCGKVKVRARVESRFYEGALPYVTGVIHGAEKGGEEVLILGHLYEQGANDNASGASIILENCRAISKLIDLGVLPRPKRTIRFLLMAECYGSLAYAEKNREKMAKTLAAVNVDTGVGRYELVGSSMDIVLTPQCCPSFVNALMTSIVKTYFSKFAPWKKWSTSRYYMATDNFYCDPLIGVPTLWTHVGMGEDYWHNSADSMDKLDPRSFRDLATVDAAFVYFLANAGYKESLWLAEETAILGAKNIMDCSENLLNKALTAKDGAQLRRYLDDGLTRIKHFTNIEKKALRSIEKLVTSNEREKLLAHLDKLEQHLDRISQMELERFEETIKTYADAVGIQLAEKGEKEKNMWERRAETIVPKRRLIGTIALDDVPYEEWEVVKKSPRWWGVETAALWWADGRRNLLEIRDLLQQEFDEIKIDLIQYFRFLRKINRIEFEEKPERRPCNY